MLGTENYSPSDHRSRSLQDRIQIRCDWPAVPGHIALHGPTRELKSLPVVRANGSFASHQSPIDPNHEKEQRVRNMRVSDASEVMTKSSPYSVAETVARFNEVVAAKDMKVFAVINHSDEAHEAGLDLPETKVIIFGNPSAGTPVMEAAPLVALELPLKVLIWEDEGRTRVSYTSPGALAERYGLCADVARMLEGIEPLTEAVIMYTHDTFGVTV